MARSVDEHSEPGSARPQRAPRVLLAWLALLVTAPHVRAATYYVASDGNDGNAGTSALPWATLQHAADTVVAGDTVRVRAGSYPGFQLTTSGTAGAPIRFASVPGEVVTISADNAFTPDGINLEGASYVTIEGFRVAGRGRAGIRAVACRHVAIVGNVATDNQRWGIFTGCCDDLRIEGNVTSGSLDEHGIYVSNSGDRPRIRGNVSFGNSDNGIHMNGDASIDCEPAVATDGVISDALVEGNTIYDNGSGGGSGINCDGVQNSQIRNNLIYAAKASGISLYRIDGGQPSSGNALENNTVVVGPSGRWAINIRDDAQNTVVRNNVLYSEHGFRGALNVCSPGCLSGLASDHNAVESVFTLDDGASTLTLAQWRTATGQDQHSTAIAGAAALDLLFVDRAVGNHHLRPGSAAVDAGVAIPGLTVDLESRPRPAGAAFDRGAFEGVDGLFADGFEYGSALRWIAPAP